MKRIDKYLYEYETFISIFKKDSSITLKNRFIYPWQCTYTSCLTIDEPFQQLFRSNLTQHGRISILKRSMSLITFGSNTILGLPL